MKCKVSFLNRRKVLVATIYGGIYTKLGTYNQLDINKTHIQKNLQIHAKKQNIIHKIEILRIQTQSTMHCNEKWYTINIIGNKFHQNMNGEIFQPYSKWIYDKRSKILHGSVTMESKSLQYSINSFSPETNVNLSFNIIIMYWHSQKRHHSKNL